MSQDYLVGEVSEDLRSVPIAEATFQAEVVRAEVVDPTTLGWEADRNTGQPIPPFGRVRWRVLADKAGGETIYAGRQTDQRVQLTPGKYIDKMGRERSNLEALAGLIRLKHGLSLKDDVRGYKLFDSSLNGLEGADAITELSRRFSEAVVGLKGNIRVYHRKTQDGPQDAVAQIEAPGQS